MCQFNYEVNCKATIHEYSEVEWELLIPVDAELTEIEIKEICIEYLSASHEIADDFEIISIKLNEEGE